MPIGIQRLNAKKSQPNDRIIFIKPLKGPDEAVAQDFLERIAAQCLPIMKEHHLSVMSLEEYEPNREFVGRNFNAGEIVQLVLKARSGHWLPFNYVQMVMMHELAHCKQMNHSRAFWAVRNNYAEQMRVLWSRGYTGDGLWGRGALLSSGEWERNTIGPGEVLPAHLCGGTYRSRRRKRKAEKMLTYKEQKERRILKKFGANGVALGEDMEAKQNLEKGRRVMAKPRVAGSARGRELRAAAALARFDQQQKEEQDEDVKVKVEPEDDDSTASEAETESGNDDYEDDTSQPDAKEADGSRILDAKGRGMVKVCGDEDPDDKDARNELLELHTSALKQPTMQTPPKSDADLTGAIRERQIGAKHLGPMISAPVTSNGSERQRTDEASKRQNPAEDAKSPDQEATPVGRQCPVCSFANKQLAITCGMCTNVLEPESVVGSWRCQSRSCVGGQYVNAGDCGVCGVCGDRRPNTPTPA